MFIAHLISLNHVPDCVYWPKAILLPFVLSLFQYIPNMDLAKVHKLQSTISEKGKMLEAHSQQLQTMSNVIEDLIQVCHSTVPQTSTTSATVEQTQASAHMGMPAKLRIVLPEKYDGLTGKCKGFLMPCAVHFLACPTKCREYFICSDCPSWKGS